MELIYSVFDALVILMGAKFAQATIFSTLFLGGIGLMLIADSFVQRFTHKKTQKTPRFSSLHL